MSLNLGVQISQSYRITHQNKHLIEVTVEIHSADNVRR